MGTTHSGSTQFTDNNFAGSASLIGADVCVRSNNYELCNANITGQYGRTFTVGTGIDGFTDGFGYFIQNSPNCLDAEGDWCYIASSKKIRIYSSTNPNTKVVKVAHGDCNFNVNNMSNIVVDNLSLPGAKTAPLTSRRPVISQYRIAIYMVQGSMPLLLAHGELRITTTS